MLTLEQALTRATSQLAAHPDLRATALADAALLLMHALGIDRATLIAHPEYTIDRDRQSLFQGLLERRLRFEPIQYILGETEFYGLALRVTDAVLIPRPETELLVEAVVERLPKQKQLQLVDVGTGSGAIAIALAHLLPNVFVTAIDLSTDALAIAAENAASHRLEDRITFVASDLLDVLTARARAGDAAGFHAIVANPPYIPLHDGPGLHPQVREHEPALALFAGTDGLDIYRRLIPQALLLLKPGGLLALEIGYGQQAALSGLLAGWDQVEFLLDLQQIPRVALARRP